MIYSSSSNYGHVDENKVAFSQQQRPAASLFSVLIDDFRESGLFPTQRNGQRPSYDGIIPSMHRLYPPNGEPASHPVDRLDDLTLNRLLQFLNEDDFRQADDENYVNLEPTPLNIPDCQNVAQATGQYNAIKAVSDSALSDMVQRPLDVSVPCIRVPDNVVASMDEKQKNDLDDLFLDVDETEDVHSANDDGRFRLYQSDLWNKRFQDLVKYQKRTGNCQVPLTYSQDPALARWVKRQRYQYKLMMEGKASTMTSERIQVLEEIGFVWDSQLSAWWDRFEELVEFKRVHGHCNVPSKYSKNPSLAVWVKCQRRQYKHFQQGELSNITPQRIRDLESLGFQWMLRSCHRKFGTSK